MNSLHQQFIIKEQFNIQALRKTAWHNYQANRSTYLIELNVLCQQHYNMTWIEASQRNLNLNPDFRFEISRSTYFVFEIKDALDRVDQEKKFSHDQFAFLTFIDLEIEYLCNTIELIDGIEAPLGLILSFEELEEYRAEMDFHYFTLDGYKHITLSKAVKAVSELFLTEQFFIISNGHLHFPD